MQSSRSLHVSLYIRSITTRARPEKPSARAPTDHWISMATLACPFWGSTSAVHLSPDVDEPLASVEHVHPALCAACAASVLRARCTSVSGALWQGPRDLWAKKASPRLDVFMTTEVSQHGIRSCRDRLFSRRKADQSVSVRSKD